MGKAKRGFTLIEILTVLTIITVGTAIFVKLSVKSRERAMAVICQSNLRQWGLIFNMYAENNGGNFFAGAVKDWRDGWFKVLDSSHIQTGGIRCCPTAAKDTDNEIKGAWARWRNEKGEYGSYGVNSWVCSPMSESSALYGEERYWRHVGIANAAKVPVFLDSIVTGGLPDNNSLPPAYNGELPRNANLTEQMKGFCIARHGYEITNCLFMDWSVRQTGLKELWKLGWHKKYTESVPSSWPEWMKNFKEY